MIFWDHAQKEWSWVCYDEVRSSECKDGVTSHQLVLRNIFAQLIPVIFSRNILNYERGSALGPVLNRVLFGIVWGENPFGLCETLNANFINREMWNGYFTFRQG